MKIAEIISHLESIAAPDYQESYDNCGLITGYPSSECSGVLVSLDATEPVIEEAIAIKCNLVVAHHPIIFSGLKKITGRNYVEKTIIKAIKNDLAIYAIHTNLDNIIQGVNARMADVLGLVSRRILAPKAASLKKLFTFVPAADLEKVRSAVFAAGAGNIGNYSEAAFIAAGEGSFKAGQGANPYVGDIGKRHYEPEVRLETVFPAHLEALVVQALRQAHPYEEVAYDIVALRNPNLLVGSGLIGELPQPLEEYAFLAAVKQSFGLSVIKHTRLLQKPVKKVALCGGAGSSLIPRALAEQADFYITADIKYHEFFDAEDRMVIADIGHFESEQFTIDLVHEILVEKFRTFAVQKTGILSNPVRYYM